MISAPWPNDGAAFQVALTEGEKAPDRPQFVVLRFLYPVF
jgi:hypothetical protein